MQLSRNGSPFAMQRRREKKKRIAIYQDMMSVRRPRRLRNCCTFFPLHEAFTSRPGVCSSPTPPPTTITHTLTHTHPERSVHGLHPTHTKSYHKVRSVLSLRRSVSSQVICAVFFSSQISLFLWSWFFFYIKQNSVIVGVVKDAFLSRVCCMLMSHPIKHPRRCLLPESVTF